MVLPPRLPLLRLLLLPGSRRKRCDCCRDSSSLVRLDSARFTSARLGSARLALCLLGERGNELAELAGAELAGGELGSLLASRDKPVAAGGGVGVAAAQRSLSIEAGPSGGQRCLILDRE